MTKSRKTVPAALHAELSEYAALLRALRTSDTLDLTSQLVKPPETKDTTSCEDDDPGLDDAEHNTLSRLPSAGPSTFSAEEGSGVVDPADDNASSRATGTRKRKAKDIWTRWPLLAGDVYIPEWTLEDEVESLASRFFKLQKSPDSETPSSDTEDFEEEEARLPPSALKNLTVVSSAFLSHVLALIAAHIPLAEKSMQNRFKPLNWENILAISSTSGLVSAQTLESVQQRLESIYGVSDSSNVISRTRSLNATREKLSEMCSLADTSLLTLNVPTATEKPKTKRKRGKYKMTGRYKRIKIAATSEVLDEVE